MASAEVPGTSDYDQTKQRFKIFLKYFVDIYELKLEAYTMFIEGKSDKAGKFANFFSDKIGQGGGAGLSFFLPTGIATKIGSTIAEPIGKKLGKKLHGEKVNNVLHLLECWKKDKSGFREKLVEAALDLGQSFEMQLMFVTSQVGGYREALRLVALDSVNRSFDCYEKIERGIEHVTISESVLRGSSKIETVLDVPIDVKCIKTPGYTIFYRNENNEWHTSSLFEKSGVVIDTDNSASYYKLKSNSKTFKYGYRRLLKCEMNKWSKLKEKYEEEPDLSKTFHFTDYNYMFSLGSEEFFKMKNDLLDHVNEKDPKLQEERMKKLLTEIKESILHEIQTLIDAKEIDHNLLVDMRKNLSELSSAILNNFVELQKNLLEITNKNHEETAKCFNLASEERQELADVNASKHEVTQGMVARVEEKIDQLKNPASKTPRSFMYKLRASNLNYVKRYNADGLCKSDEINAHFYPNNDSDDSKSPIPVVIICGPAGVGKSEEGRQYCKFWWDRHKECDRAVLSIDCTTITSFIDTFKSIGFKCKIWTNDNVSKTEREIVEEIYSYFLDRETLFVFDNADEHIQKFLPQSVSLVLHDRQKLPCILMTSRTKSWDGANEGFAQFQLVELGVFTKQEGLNYVKDSLKLSVEETAKDKDILDLCKLLHSLPLALRQAVAYIQAETDSVGQYSIADYIAEYKVDGKKLLGFMPYKNDEERYPNPVLSTWLVTLEKIKNQDDGKEARDILNILAYLSPNAIQLHQILGISVIDSRSKKDRNLKAGIQLLSKYSLIDLDSDRRVYIHELVQEVVRIQLKKVSIVWQGALCFVFLSFLFIIANAIFSFRSELSDQLALAVGFISFLYVVLTACNIEKRTIEKVLDLFKSENVSPDCDTTKHVRQVWYYATDYSTVLFKNYFVIKNWFPLNVSIQSYGPSYDTQLHFLSSFHTKSANNFLWYLSFLGKLPILKKYIVFIVNATNNAGYTPLHVLCVASSLNKMRIAEILINQGANIEAKDVKGKTPLHWTVISRKVDMAELLIKRGANIEAEDKDKETPLYLVAFLGKVDMAELLIKHGANIEAENKHSNTPLHCAVLVNNVDMIQFLIKHNANIEAKNVGGSTPLRIAVRKSVLNMRHLANVKDSNTLHTKIRLTAFDNDDSCLTAIFLLALGANIGSIRQSEEIKTRLLTFLAGNLDDITKKLFSIAGQDIEHKIPLVKQLLESENGEENVAMLE